MTNSDTSRIGALDGLRGYAALWVVAGHSLNLSGAWIPILGRPLLAVDLFMMLSGALMIYQADKRAESEPFSEFRTWMRFWTRRFFRIAPLFYFVLVIALLLGPMNGEARQVIANTLGIDMDWPRYADRSLANIAQHVTFLFGFFPAYAERTPLPDWSIGLEMQFYLFFPLIALFARWIGLVRTAVIGTLASVAFGLAFPEFLASFPQPTLLVIKMPLFFAGMLIMRARSKLSLGGLALAAILAITPVGMTGHWSESVVRLLLVCLMIAILIRGIPMVEVIATPIHWILATPFSRWLGDVSYGVYLFHLPIVVAIVSYVIQSGLPPLGVAAIAFALSIGPVFLCAHLGHRMIELPGIAVGRRLLGRKWFTPSQAPTLT